MRHSAAALAVALSLLAGCATRTPPPAPPRPAPATPELSAIHRNLDPLGSLWHVRAGLNVAALSCAQRVGPGIVTDYNQFLKAKQSLLAKAYDALSANYRAKGGSWQSDLDRDMTRLYNHFASPTAQPGFCDAAAAEVKRAIDVHPDGYEGWAADALARLDKPFTQPQMAAFAARAAPMVAPRAASPAGAAGWRIQLGAFGSKSAAEAAWDGLKSRSPRLAGLTPHFEPVPGKSLTRLQVKDVNSQSDAIRLCAHAAGAGFDCFPVKPA